MQELLLAYVTFRGLNTQSIRGFGEAETCEEMMSGLRGLGANHSCNHPVSVDELLLCCTSAKRQSSHRCVVAECVFYQTAVSSRTHAGRSVCGGMVSRLHWFCLIS